MSALEGVLPCAENRSYLFSVRGAFVVTLIAQKASTEFDPRHPRRSRSRWVSTAIILLGWATLAGCVPRSPPTCADCTKEYETETTICQTASGDPTGGGREGCLDHAQQSYKSCQMNCTSPPVH
jgi:hypothetical protein